MNLNRTILTMCFVAALSSCTKTEQIEEPGSSELILSVAEKMLVPETKGYVVGETLFDTPYAGLHDGSTTTARTLYVSAHLYPQSGEEEDYLVGEPFVKSDTDSYWHHDPKIYWPQGGQLSFLILSSGQDLTGLAKWCSWNCSEKVTVAVDSTFTQDDLLFSSKDKSSVVSYSAFQFQHSQAWIEFCITACSGYEGKYIFRGIDICKAYNAGDLTVTSNYGSPKMSWSFRRFERRDRRMDDPCDIAGSIVGSSALYMDMLLPEQEKTSYVIRYSKSSDPETVLTQAIDLPHENWLAGRKYVYDISFGK